MQTLMGYPGGKRLTRRLILPILRAASLRDREYRELFAGGLSVGMNMFEASRRGGWVNDIDVGVYAVWTAVKFFPDQLGAGVRRFQPTADAFVTIKRYFLANPPMPTEMRDVVEMAVRKLAVHAMSYSGLGEMGSLSWGHIHKSWHPKAICTRIDRIHPILRGVQVSNVDCLTVIRDEGKPAILYGDPPYSCKSRTLYRHSFAMADHIRLRDALQATGHEWLLSYDDVPEIRALYSPWAHIERIPVTYSISGSSKAAHELLISKRDYRNDGMPRRRSEASDVRFASCDPNECRDSIQ
jgi:DNA adenine methylase